MDEGQTAHYVVMGMLTGYDDTMVCLAPVILLTRRGQMMWAIFLRPGYLTILSSVEATALFVV